jgi:hypothetical protein
LQFAVTDELSAAITTMDKDDVCPAFDTHNQVSGNFQQSRDDICGDAEFLEGLNAAK